MSRIVNQRINCSEPAVQPAHVADAASGERDRGDFESWFRLGSFPDLLGRRG
jgi:hypothetical protein